MKVLHRLAAAAAFLGAATAAQAQDVNIIVVSHGQANDPFWSVVKNGVEAAAKDMGVKVDYRAPETFDMVVMSQLIDAAVNQEPDGLIVSIPDVARTAQGRSCRPSNSRRQYADDRRPNASRPSMRTLQRLPGSMPGNSVDIVFRSPG